MKIQGEYIVPHVYVISGSTSTPPNFCHECGNPYPWIERKLEAAKELADELDELSVEEKERLKKSLDEIIIDSPKTEIAGTRFKKIMGKVGIESYSVMKKIVTDIISETMKKTLFGG
jgi:hypothetical protein